MIKIGDFAKLCNTNAQTLRYYDTEGLLKADYVDISSGYRYYTEEALEKYKKILFYKSLGFTLEDIKRLFTLPKQEILSTLMQKKEEMLALIQSTKRQISVIDGLCATNSISARFTRDIFQIPFENDPEVIGKWQLCGQIENEENPDPTSCIEPSVISHKEIVFMPGGTFYWMFFWTKGTLYEIPNKFKIAIPNSYRIFSFQNVKYLILQYMNEQSIFNGKAACPLLYRQIDNCAYSENQIRVTDSTDLPFIEDPEVLGSWTVCDFVPNTSDFKPHTRYTEKCGSYITRVSFLPRGVFLKGAAMVLRYTKGYVLNDKAMTAEKYFLKTIYNIEYLFIQHKSGDYIYGGRKPYWYVFKREN